MSTRRVNGTCASKTEKLLAFLDANGWTVSFTKKNHLKLTHPVAGMRFHSFTSSDWRAQLNCISQCKNMMRAKGLAIR